MTLAEQYRDQAQTYNKTALTYRKDAIAYDQGAAACRAQLGTVRDPILRQAYTERAEQFEKLAAGRRRVAGQYHALAKKALDEAKKAA